MISSAHLNKDSLWALWIIYCRVQLYNWNIWIAAMAPLRKWFFNKLIDSFLMVLILTQELWLRSLLVLQLLFLSCHTRQRPNCSCGCVIYSPHTGDWLPDQLALALEWGCILITVSHSEDRKLNSLVLLLHSLIVIQFFLLENDEGEIPLISSPNSKWYSKL